jgi:hypothetical protein
MWKKDFSKRNIENCKDQLKIKLWDDFYIQSYVNSAYCIFLSKLHKYFLHFSPFKKVFNKKGRKSSSTTQGIKVSRQAAIVMFVKEKNIPISSHFKVNSKVNISENL